MSKNIIVDLDLWLVSIASGVCMAFAYDFLRLFRRLVRHRRFVVDIEDLLYWTLCFFASFTILYYANNGVIRFVAVLGAALGMLLY
ncbi:MAG: spore cortex biosynthesis protein YabQ, partial [Lachnospiraceae bacterium]|nr:spore cortex biosynthesis protein YabQ [Lachnospiraceae bacterium]